MSTYREEIQLMIIQLRTTYDNAGYLVDQSDPDGQEILKQVRSILVPTWGLLQKLDKIMNDVIANQEV